MSARISTAPKYCTISQRGEFEFELKDSDGETVGIYSTDEKAREVKIRREAHHRDQFMKSWGAGSRRNG